MRPSGYNFSTSGKKWEKVVNMFYGSYSHSLDSKGRLVIPSKMRKELDDNLFVMKGFDGALSLYKSSDFDKLIQELNNLEYHKKNSRAYLRVQLASVIELEIDRLGRVQLPTQLLNKYQIGKDVIVIGALDHIEVWDQKEYEKYVEEYESNFETLAESIEHR